MKVSFWDRVQLMNSQKTRSTISSLCGWSGSSLWSSDWRCLILARRGLVLLSAKSHVAQLLVRCRRSHHTQDAQSFRKRDIGTGRLSPGVRTDLSLP